MYMLETCMAWNSLVKEESLGCQITSPFNKKFGCFVRNSFSGEPRLQILKFQLLNGEVIWQASDSSLSKDLHVYGLGWGLQALMTPVKVTRVWVRIINALPTFRYIRYMRKRTSSRVVPSSWGSCIAEWSWASFKGTLSNHIDQIRWNFATCKKLVES